MGAAPSSAPSFCWMLCCHQSVLTSHLSHHVLASLTGLQGSSSLKALHRGERERDGAPGCAGHGAYIILLWEVTDGRQWSD